MNSNTSTALWERLPQARLSLAKAFDLYEASNRARNFSPSTIRFYRDRIRAFIQFVERQGGGEATLNDFTPQNFRLFILEKREIPKYVSHPFRQATGAMPSPAYIHGYFRVVRSFSSWLFAEGLIPVNAMKELKLPKLEERELEPLTAEEELRLLNAYSETKAGECRDKGIFMLMLSTGIRRGELLGLKDSAVNLEEGFITVMGKGRKQRSVPFGFKTAWVLQRYRLLHRPKPATPKIDNFFLSQDGYPMTPNSLQMLFRRAGKRTGITRLHPHLLRHTYGTRSSELGIPTLTLQRFMGHSTPNVTERYGHVATSERLKRERSYDHLDGMELRVRRPRMKTGA
jgi:integrase/recombinase XerC/integrase/recombinase XerD